MNVTLMERMDFQLFFNVMTIAIDTLLHALWHFLYTLVIEISCHLVQVVLLLLTVRIRLHSLQTVTRRSSSISCSTFAIVSTKTKHRPQHCLSWMSLRPYVKYLTTFACFWRLYTMAHRLFITDDKCQWGLCPWHSRNGHCMELTPGGKGRCSSIANRVKTERRSGLGFVEISNGGAKLHASDAGSHVNRFSWLLHLGDLILQTHLVF